jgi:hypothetical protein
MKAIYAILIAVGALFGFAALDQAQPSVCHVRGQLPDPVCTPGATNPAVTQANIQSTICKKGWTATVRPPQSYTSKLKVQGIKDYGYADTNVAHYEADHLVPLEVAGSPSDPRNIWPELGTSPNAKDAVENRVRADVCSGKITLAQGQQVFLTDWTKYR